MMIVDMYSVTDTVIRQLGRDGNLGHKSQFESQLELHVCGL